MPTSRRRTIWYSPPAPGNTNGLYMPIPGNPNGLYIPIPGNTNGLYMPIPGNTNGLYIPIPGNPNGLYMPIPGNPNGLYIPITVPQTVYSVKRTLYIQKYVGCMTYVGGMRASRPTDYLGFLHRTERHITIPAPQSPQNTERLTEPAEHIPPPIR